MVKLPPEPEVKEKMLKHPFYPRISMNKKLKALDKAKEWLVKIGYEPYPREVVRVARFLIEVPFSPRFKPPFRILEKGKKKPKILGSERM